MGIGLGELFVIAMILGMVTIPFLVIVGVILFVRGRRQRPKR